MTLFRPRWLVVAAALAFVVAAPGVAGAQDDAGQIVFNNACRTCHTVKAGDNRLGPNLHKVVGRKAGGAEGFAYSDSMKNSGLTWDEKTLDAFIENPDAVVSGNNMKPYTGMSSSADRAKIVSYLKAQSEG